MMQREAQSLIQKYLREQFGRLLQIREFGTLRRAAGIFFRAEVMCISSDGEIPVGCLTVDEKGRLVEKITLDDLISVLRSFVPVSLEDGHGLLPDQEKNPFAEEFADFGLDDDFGATAGEDEGLGFLLEDTFDEMRTRVDGLLEKNTLDSLRQALQLMPRLLTEAETRGEVLTEMAELEAEVGTLDVALGYLDAASREFADRSRLEGLERVATLTLDLIGEERFAEHPIKALLTQAKERVTPVEDLFALDYFETLLPEQRAVLEQGIERLTLAPEDDLVKEGDQAEHAYIIESGQFSVLLEAPDGSARTIRCMFPGELVGEAAVLDGGGGFRTATVRADQVSTVWQLGGEVVRKLIAADPSLGAGIERARELRRVHSFFSMHETMGQLDVQVRDELLSCIMAISNHAQGEVLIGEELIPERAFLVAQGGIDYLIGDQVARHYAPDTFAGLRDTIMAIATQGRYVVSTESTLVEFNGDKLRTLCENAPAAVIAVLERLE